MKGEVVLPDLGFDDEPVVLNLWLIKQGARVAEGEPVVEVMVGAATVDLPSPVDGVLKKLVAEGQTLIVGQTLARIQVES